MKVSTLQVLAPLLAALRDHPALTEGSPGEFHLRDGRRFIHFHEGAEGIYGDVLLAKGRVAMRVSTNAEQDELLERIDRVLESLAVRVPKQTRER